MGIAHRTNRKNELWRKIDLPELDGARVVAVEHQLDPAAVEADKPAADRGQRRCTGAGEAVGDVPGMGVIEHRTGQIVVEEGGDEAGEVDVIHVGLHVTQGVGVAPVAFEALAVA